MRLMSIAAVVRDVSMGGGGAYRSFSRDTDEVAHFLANSIQVGFGECIWADCCPRAISYIVLNDLLNKSLGSFDTFPSQKNICCLKTSHRQLVGVQ